jgi:hypothetical protein
MSQPTNFQQAKTRPKNHVDLSVQKWCNYTPLTSISSMMSLRNWILETAHLDSNPSSASDIPHRHGPTTQPFYAVSFLFFNMGRIIIKPSSQVCFEECGS